MLCDGVVYIFESPFVRVLFVLVIIVSAGCIHLVSKESTDDGVSLL
jgi:hypothetical protein